MGSGGMQHALFSAISCLSSISPVAKEHVSIPDAKRALVGRATGGRHSFSSVVLGGVYGPPITALLDLADTLPSTKAAATIDHFDNIYSPGEGAAKQ